MYVQRVGVSIHLSELVPSFNVLFARVAFQLPFVILQSRVTPERRSQMICDTLIIAPKSTA